MVPPELITSSLIISMLCSALVLPPKIFEASEKYEREREWCVGVLFIARMYC